MRRILYGSMFLLLSSAAMAQERQIQFPVVARGGIEILDKAPAVGAIEAEKLLLARSLLLAIAEGKLVVQQPVPAPTTDPAPSPTPTPAPPKPDKK